MRRCNERAIRDCTDPEILLLRKRIGFRMMQNAEVTANMTTIRSTKPGNYLCRGDQFHGRVPRCICHAIGLGTEKLLFQVPVLRQTTGGSD
jgi:hypothetical protein